MLTVIANSAHPLKHLCLSTFAPGWRRVNVCHLITTSLWEGRVQNDESPAVTDEDGMEQRCRHHAIGVHIRTARERDHRQVRSRDTSKTERANFARLG